MALLGLLYREPGYGYDLHRKILSDLGQVWHLSQSQAYAILKRLESHGDVFVEQIAQKKLPSRQLHYITLQGITRFLTWLDSTSGGSTRVIRMEFITRLYFLNLYFPEKLLAAFNRQRHEAITHIQRLESARANLTVDQIYNLMSIDLRLKQLHGVLEWMDEFQNEFNN